VINTRAFLALMSLAICSTATLAAQSLAKRHQLELRIGGWSQVTDSRTSVGIGGVTTSVGSNGFIGGFAYGHWLQENVAFRISVGLMSANMEVQASGLGVSTEFAGVLPVLFGMRYFFPVSSDERQFRPFAGLGVGMFVGGQESVRAGFTTSTTSRTETAVGGAPEAGIGILLGRSVLATVAFSYNLMFDFENPIGGSSNYSGPQMTLGLSYIF